MRVGEAIRLDRDDLDLDARAARRPRQQVRQVPRAAAAPEHGRGAARLPAPPRPARCRDADTRRCSSRSPARGCSTATSTRRSAHSSRTPDCGRARRPAGRVRTTCATRFAVRTVLDAYRAGGDVAGAAAAALDLPRPRRSRRHLLVPVGRARSCSRSPASGSSGTSEARHERARTDPAGVLHRPAASASARPARTRSPPTATRCGCCSRFAARSAPARSRRELDLDDLDAPLIAAFLDHLEHERGNSVRTRNARLAAIHSLFRYAALRHPEHAAADPARARDPAQALRPRARHASSPSPRSTRCSPPRPRHLDRPPRPRAAAARRSRPACAPPS